MESLQLEVVPAEKTFSKAAYIYKARAGTQYPYLHKVSVFRVPRIQRSPNEFKGRGASRIHHNVKS